MTMETNQKDHCYQTPSRLQVVDASDFQELGKSLAKIYNKQFEQGIERTKDFYVLKAPITFTTEKWKCLAEQACCATQQCCPTASMFFKGLSEGLGRDVYLGMLDFELYTLELHRQVEEKAARAATVQGRDRSSSSSSSTTSSTGSGRETGDDGGRSGSEDSIQQDADEHVTNANIVEKEATDELCEDIDPTLEKTMADIHSQLKRDRPLENSQMRPSKNQPKQIKLCSEDDLHESPEGTITDSSAETAQISKLTEPNAKHEELPGHCTGFALVSGEAQAQRSLLTQTVDLPGSIYGFGDFDTVLQLSVPGRRVLVYDCDGRLCPIGFNSAGLGVAVFNFHQTPKDGFDAQMALSVQSLVWELLLGHDTLESAMAWLHNLPCKMMCGSALLLADASGAVTAELSPCAEVQFGEVQRDAPVVRANHPILERFEETCGSSAKSRRASSRRQEVLTLELLNSQKGAKLGGEICQVPSDAAQSLAILTRSRKIRSNATLACISCDLRKLELHVQFRERQLADDPDLIEHIAKQVEVEPEKVEKMLVSGALKGDAGIPRMTTGLPSPHLIQWRSYVFVLQR